MIFSNNFAREEVRELDYNLKYLFYCLPLED